MIWAKCNRVIVSLGMVCALYAVAGAVFHCGEWSSWYNSSTPAMYNGSKELEEVPLEVLSACGHGRTVKCKDEKGEPFKERINFTSGDYKVLLSCSSSFGATCLVISENGSCYDLAIQFHCDCPSTPDITTITMASSDTTSPNKNLPTESVSFSRLGAKERTKTTWFPGIGNATFSQNEYNVSVNGRGSHNSGNNSIISTILLLLLPILPWLRVAFFC